MTFVEKILFSCDGSSSNRSCTKQADTSSIPAINFPAQRKNYVDMLFAALMSKYIVNYRQSVLSVFFKLTSKAE